MLIEKANGKTYSQCRIPGIVITENGTLLAYYECRKSNSDWAEIDIKITVDKIVAEILQNKDKKRQVV